MTAERIRVIVQQFYNHAVRNLLVTTNPAQPLRGAIARAPVQHHRHLSEKELGAFWRKLDEQGAHVTTIAATKLLMLTMDPQERPAALQVARVRPGRGAVGSTRRAHEDGQAAQRVLVAPGG